MLIAIYVENINCYCQKQLWSYILIVDNKCYQGGTVIESIKQIKKLELISCVLIKGILFITIIYI